MSARECRVFERLMVLSLEGELGVARTRKLDDHLKRCPACRRDFSAYCCLRRELKGLAPEPAPAGLPGLPPAPVPRPLLPLPARLSVTAALALLIAFSALAGNRFHREARRVEQEALMNAPSFLLTGDWLADGHSADRLVPENAPLLPELEDYFLLEALSPEEQRQLAEILTFI